ncbi:MAG TPA: hypothetical protein VGI92_10475 [Gemmatimonadales bacterium]|jgi:hypothetical protein
MAIDLTCTCGRVFQFEDQYAGQTITCPDCRKEIVVPAAPARPGQADAAFERDVFLVRQKIRLDEKYAITDEAGNALLFVVRPRHFLRNLGSLFVGALAGIAWFAACFALAPQHGVGAAIFGMIGAVGCLPITVLAALPLSALRHTSFYRDESLGEPLLTVLQDKKFQPIIATFTVRDDKGKKLAKLEKNYLYNFIRKRWIMTGPDGKEIMMAIEDSRLKAFLRRFIGPLFGLLRTNFVFMTDADDKIGEFNRKMTILDRYVLDLSDDPKRTFDRRLALALGVMLDTGERR